jgi:hypothetical protein
MAHLFNFGSYYRRIGTYFNDANSDTAIRRALGMPQ